jgi:prophage antirepressor-like protein
MKQVGIFGDICVYGSFEIPWFNAKQISRHLDIQNPRNIIRTLHSDDKHILAQTKRSECLISETALFMFFIHAPKTSSSLSFQRKMKRVILPTIRLQQIQKQQRVIHQLGHFIENIKTRQKSQIIYIATSRRYAEQSIFKVGGCSSTDLLTKRLATYNTGRIGEDELYYVALFNCDNHNHMEARIKELLYEFRHVREKEMYIIHYISLYEMIQQMIIHYNVEIDQLNTFIRNLTQLSEPINPTPIPPLPKSLRN